MNIYISFLYFAVLFAVVYSEEDLENVIKVKILGYLKNRKCYQRWYLVLRHEVLTKMKPKICNAIGQLFARIVPKVPFGSEYCWTDIFDDLHPDGAVRVSAEYHIPVGRLRLLNKKLSVVDVLGMFTKYLLDSEISDGLSQKIEELASYKRSVMDVKTNLCKPVPIDHNYDHRKLILLDGK